MRRFRQTRCQPAVLWGGSLASFRAAVRLSIFLLLCAFFALPAPPQNPPGEFEVKAAFVFHFAQMVEWPSGTFGSDTSPLLMCTIDDDSNSSALEGVVNGKRVGSHPIRTRRLRDAAGVPGCHLLVIASRDRNRASSILAAVKDAPILTIGDSQDFIAAGGIIGLCIENNKIRFDINLNAAQRANLKINSRLLLLARGVIGGSKQG